MATITIKNVGPIKDVTIDLNKVNVFMGPQSSGKSTIAKIISFCSWIEKEDTLTLGGYRPGMIEFASKLETFHNMKGYLQEDSVIKYKSDNDYEISYMSAEDMMTVSPNDKTSRHLQLYERPKIFYIPAERHVVLLPEIMKVDFPDNNMRSYVFDWLTARKYYPRKESVNILELTAEYYYNEARKEDTLVMSNGKELLLSNASSGLQSVTPLIVLINYFTEWIYGHEEEISFEKKQRNKQLENQLSSNMELVKKLTESQYTRLILEEPEQNLFPTTQRDLLYYLLHAIQSETHDHQLILTTHSPYILYALNNCMLAGMIKDNIPEDIRHELPCYTSKIDPSLVSVWEIEDGRIRSIQDEDHIIAENYFDQKLTELTDEYYTMLNFYDDERKTDGNI